MTATPRFRRKARSPLRRYGKCDAAGHAWARATIQADPRGPLASPRARSEVARGCRHPDTALPPAVDPGEQQLPRVRIFSWNPRRSALPARLARWLPVGQRVNNFGDLLGPLVVNRLLARHGIASARGLRECTLFSVGSVLHFAHDGDVVWGSGVNGKMPGDSYLFRRLDVRAVRGPLTRDFLQSRGIEVPTTFGDPALLLPTLAPELFAAARRDQHAITVVPNFNDLPAYAADPDVLNPRSPLEVCLNRLAAAGWWWVLRCTPSSSLSRWAFPRA